MTFYKLKEEETKRLKSAFINEGELTKSEVLEKLVANGFIEDNFLGRLKGELFLRVVHPLEEPLECITGYYFSKYRGKYHLTYAGGMDF